ncbi:MAG: dihydropteroate synthase [Chloroflexi bacterium]|nr:dihydropteroate synthase [Chloroflexota bacterium]
MKIGATEFSWGKRTYVMGVVNVTPDSFSGDGTLRDAGSSDRWVQAAVEQALRMEDDGADVIDVGGESTRPPSMYTGAVPVNADEECGRVLPVIEALRNRLGAPISIDTRKAEVARAAVNAGAAMINDVSMLGDPEMAATAASAGVPVVISHIRPKAIYSNPVLDVATDLEDAIKRAAAAGVSRELIIADPGIGFGKTALHSLAVLRGLSDIKQRLHCPLLVGTSRKSFIGAVLGLPARERLEGTAATMALAVAAGADMVRVHDVKEMARVVRMADAVVRGWEPGPDS